MKLTVVRNDPECGSGHLGRVARAKGIDVDVVALDAGDPLPDPTEVEAAAVLGGEMGAYDVDRFPFLANEKAWLADLVDADVPVLGICLGCQLLADVLGGSAHLAEAPEIAFTTLEVVEPDPVVDVLGRVPSLAIHRDTWTLPPGGTLIARSDRYPHAFRLGSALGIQTHPEVDEDIVGVWTANPKIVPFLAADGKTTGDLTSWIEGNAALIAATGDELFGAWFDEAADRSRGSAGT